MTEELCKKLKAKGSSSGQWECNDVPFEHRTEIEVNYFVIHVYTM